MSWDASRARIRDWLWVSYNGRAKIRRLFDFQRSDRKLEGQDSEQLSLGRKREVGMLKPEVLSEATASDQLGLSWSKEECQTGQA